MEQHGDAAALGRYKLLLSVSHLCVASAGTGRKRRGAAGEPPSLRWRLTTAAAAAAAFFLSPLQACLDAHLESVINWSLDLVLFFFIYFCLAVDRRAVLSRSSSGPRGCLIKTPEDG